MNKATLGACCAAVLLCPGVVQAEDAAQIERGKTIFQQWCVSCHGAGPGHPGTQALDMRYKGSVPGALQDRTNLTPDFVKIFVRNGISIMPFFRKTEISDTELADLGAYLARNTPKQGQP